MDLIQSYHDQGSQSSSSDDDTKLLRRNSDTPSTSYSNEFSVPMMVSNFQPLERVPIDRLMISTAEVKAQQPVNHKKKQKEEEALNFVRSWLYDIEKELHMCLGSIQILQKRTILETMDHFISKLKKDYVELSKLSRVRLLTHYIRTFLHICKYLFRTLEKGKRYYKRFIILLGIYTDLELCASLDGKEFNEIVAARICQNYQTYLDLSDNSMVLDVWLETKRVNNKHTGILGRLFEYFLVRAAPTELPDILFMKNLLMFKKWQHIGDPEQRKKARNVFVKFIKPKKTICMNSLFKPYLPVDAEGFVTIVNPIDILDKKFALESLANCIKTAAMHVEVHKNEEIIVLTDDENDEDGSHQGPSSASCSNHDEMSYDFDWYSSSSQQGHSSLVDQKNIYSVSIESPPPPQLTHNRKSLSISSLDSCNMTLDATSSCIDQNGRRVNGNFDKRNQSILDESLSNRLMNDTNSMHFSISFTPSDERTTENGESNQTHKENEKVNGLFAHTSIPHSVNGDEINLDLLTIANSSIVQKNSNFSSIELTDAVDSDKNCDKSISSCNSLSNETLKNSDNNDLRNIDNSSEKYCLIPKNTASTELSLIREITNAEMEIMERVQELLPMESETMSESNASHVVVSNMECSKDDSPIMFIVNGTNQNQQLKTYSRRPPAPRVIMERVQDKVIETKTISTQTSRYSLSGRPSPLLIIEENMSSEKRRHLVTDETFSSHILNANDNQGKEVCSPRFESPIRILTIQNASTPITSTSNVSEDVPATNSMDTGIGTAEKRKRGRPRKYPIGSTTPAPKTPKRPRRPRQPKLAKLQSETDDEPVIEKRVLRARKPKPVSNPEQIVHKIQKELVARPKRTRRRNTIKMTIDAIFNTQSQKLRAIQARRISQILGIPLNSQKIATILKRHSYNKTINISTTINSDLNGSSMLQTFKNRSNGQINSNSTINEMDSHQHSTSSTILARKTYIKPNITISSFSSSFSSAIRRLSFSARRMSRRISISATKRSNKRASSPRKPQTQQQRYTKIDIYDTSKKRGRKKGTKDSAPRKKPGRKKQAELKNNTSELNIMEKPIIDIGNKVNENIDIVDLTNNQSDEFAQFELNTTDEMQNQFANIHTELSSTHHIQSNQSISNIFDTEETEFTNEFTTDPDSTVDADTDDNTYTRKSKRCRRRPKILDL